MTDSDLMFRPATELAAMVRSGEVSSRELVETLACANRGARTRSSTRSSTIDARARARDRRARSRPAIERPFAGVPIAIKNNRAGGRACRLTDRLLADGRARGATTTTTSSRACRGGGLRDRGYD